jgi:mRNA interferase MazF
MKAVVPARGEIWVVNFNPGRGSEQRGIRPAVILQNDVGNRYAATTIVAAITTTLKPYPVTVALRKGEGGLNMPSMVNLAQMLTVDKSRLERRLGSLSVERMAAVDEAVLISLGIELQRA